MHWKIARDPYLSLLHRTSGEAAVYESGFFLDDDPEDAPLDDVDWLCTPAPKLRISGARPAVLLSTGGFCPLHAGHLEMMERARVAALAAGYDVVGGYLSPGHDAYLQHKCGPLTPHTRDRLRHCAAAIAGSSWLSLDPWEAMHRRVAVNFTDVTARLERYLQRHVHPGLQVLFVCGGDNARFASAFSERGHCIVVSRPGSEGEVARWQRRLAGQAHVTWVEGGHPAASRTMRTAPASVTRPRLVLRLEDERAVRSLGLRSYATFQQQLVELLGRYADVRCTGMDSPAFGPHVINLDALHRAQHELAISRLFALGGYEALGFVARPGSDSLEAQLQRIPPGSYVLHDDDCVTGSTLDAARALLPAHVIVRDTRLAITHADDEDVVDARDFLLGADDGGLVVALPSGLARAPYLLPYVDPAVRAGIAASHAFSIELWSLNAQTFAGTGLCVRDLPAPARALFTSADDTRLEALCRTHVTRLQQLTTWSAAELVRPPR